jgi:hypothetical protein
MGDRATVKVVDGDDAVYLYTHWKGHRLPAIVHAALKRQQRWDDGPYLARIIFCEMLGSEKEMKAETGYGISARFCDSSYPVIAVDCVRNELRLEAAGDIEPPKKAKPIPFATFIATPEMSWKALGCKD